MMQPKKTKFRKAFKGRIHGNAKGGFALNFGEFGRTHQDLTAIGTVVNVASRAQSAAAPDQILITSAVREKAAATLPESAGREYQLKGIDAPAKLWAA